MWTSIYMIDMIDAGCYRKHLVDNEMASQGRKRTTQQCNRQADRHAHDSHYYRLSY